MFALRFLLSAGRAACSGRALDGFFRRPVGFERVDQAGDDLRMADDDADFARRELSSCRSFQ